MRDFGTNGGLANLSQYEIIMFALSKIDEKEATLTDGGCYGGGKVYFNRDEVCQSNERENYPNWIKAIWCGGETDENGQEITWTYETEIPQETFMIYEDGEPYCRGIVFSVEDLK